MSTHDADARELVALYAERVRLTRDMAESKAPNAAMVNDIFLAGAALNAACQEFRRRHYPRSGQVCVGLYEVIVSSAARRTHRTVYDGYSEFAPQAVTQ